MYQRREESESTKCPRHAFPNEDTRQKQCLSYARTSPSAHPSSPVATLTASHPPPSPTPALGLSLCVPPGLTERLRATSKYTWWFQLTWPNRSSWPILISQSPWRPRRETQTQEQGRKGDSLMRVNEKSRRKSDGGNCDEKYIFAVFPVSWHTAPQNPWAFTVSVFLQTKEMTGSWVAVGWERAPRTNLWGRERGWGLSWSQVANGLFNHSYIIKPP